MIQIPEDIFEKKLISWLFLRLSLPFYSDEDKSRVALLTRLSKAQMKERDRGEEYPFIAKVEVEEGLHHILYEYSLSENVQIRAFCKDILCKYTKGKKKFDFAISASKDYLTLYERTSSPEFILRAVTVRSYKAVKSETFISDLCFTLRKCIWPGWIVEICRELRKSYTTKELVELSLLFKEKSRIINDFSHRADERFYIEALYVIGSITKSELSYENALSYESEVDYINANKEPDTIYANNVDIIQKAYNEIFIVKRDYPCDFKRIEKKLLEEQQGFNKNLQLYGQKLSFSISDDFIKQADKIIESATIVDAVDAISYLRSLPFIPKTEIDKVCNNSTMHSSLMSMCGCQQLGERGHILGSANPEDSIRIYIYKYLRIEWKYIIRNSLAQIKKLNENELGQALYEYCKSTYINQEHILFWVRGIMYGLKSDFISSVHILVPQIERSLVNKAESIYGDLSVLNREDHQDVAGLTKALDKLKPLFKEDIYNDLRFFLNMGADVNLRNNVAHGLWSQKDFEEHGPYLWWLALKMFFCEDEIFTND